MQRQSIGSPNSKPHGHGGAKEDSLIVEDDLKRKDLSASSSITTDYGYEDDEHKATKRHRLSSPPPVRAEKFIHFIPVLTLFCFLVLYLCSHSPTQSDLAHFNGFKWSAKRIDDPAENEIGDIDRFMELPKGDVLTLRSLRNLQGIKKHGPKSRNHRKLADF